MCRVLKLADFIFRWAVLFDFLFCYQYILLKLSGETVTVDPMVTYTHTYIHTLVFLKNQSE
jgi:hypothetical protein